MMEEKNLSEGIFCETSLYELHLSEGYISERTFEQRTFYDGLEDAVSLFGYNWDY